MNATHIHLLLNHVPVLLPIVALPALLYGLIRKNAVMTNASLIAMIVSAIAAIIVFQTGEGAEEAVEEMPGVAEATIERHEEAASGALWGLTGLGIVALAGLAENLVRNRRRTGNNREVMLTTPSGTSEIGRRNRPTFLPWTAVAVALIAIVMTAHAANLGGEIRHPEIAGNASRIVPGDVGGDAEAGGAREGQEEGDDD